MTCSATHSHITHHTLTDHARTPQLTAITMRASMLRNTLHVTHCMLSNARYTLQQMQHTHRNTHHSNDRAGIHSDSYDSAQHITCRTIPVIHQIHATHCNKFTLHIAANTTAMIMRASILTVATLLNRAPAFNRHSVAPAFTGQLLHLTSRRYPTTRCTRACNIRASADAGALGALEQQGLAASEAWDNRYRQKESRYIHIYTYKHIYICIHMYTYIYT